MENAAILVRDLTKTYRVPKREAGFRASIKSFVRRQYQDVEAVKKISFQIQPGEMVGFIGPNGAGKTTTLKLLSGLLYPTTGEARVLDSIPWERRAGYLQRISMVLGNKSQMLWDIPPMDTFRVLGEVYRVPPAEFRKNMDELISLLRIENLLTKPVRNLSLGERMKCELAAGLIHRPAVLFLDEPTLGLDVSMQRRLRVFLAEYNQRRGVTILLTSHYMADVMALCPRVLLINEGRLLYDGALQKLAKQLAPFKLLRLGLDVDSENIDMTHFPVNAEVIHRENGTLTLRVERGDASRLTGHLLNTLPIADLTVEDPPIEAVIDQIYQGGDL